MCGPAPQPRVIANCERCGKPVKWAARPSRQGRFCSRACANNSLKGKGGMQYSQGRWFVRLRDGSKQHYARCVMEAHLGRDLTHDEHVHHVNGDKADDRVENLAVLHFSEHHAIHVARGDYGRRPWKLTAEQIAEIQASSAAASTLAERFNVSAGLIYYYRRKPLLKSANQATR